MSGKVNELIDSHIGGADAPSAGRDQRGFGPAPAPRGRRFGQFHSPLDTRQDELAHKTSAAGCRFAKPPVEIARQID